MTGAGVALAADLILAVRKSPGGARSPVRPRTPAPHRAHAGHPDRAHYRERGIPRSSGWAGWVDGEHADGDPTDPLVSRCTGWFYRKLGRRLVVDDRDSAGAPPPARLPRYRRIQVPLPGHRKPLWVHRRGEISATAADRRTSCARRRIRHHGRGPGVDQRLARDERARARTTAAASGPPNPGRGRLPRLYLGPPRPPPGGPPPRPVSSQIRFVHFGRGGDGGRFAAILRPTVGTSRYCWVGARRTEDGVVSPGSKLPARQEWNGRRPRTHRIRTPPCAGGGFGGDSWPAG